MNWDDLRAFLVFGGTHSVNAASQGRGMSPATLGRRIRALEADLGMPLVVRAKSGTSLTAAGRELMALGADMEIAAKRISRWSSALPQDRLVKISAGSWMTLFLTRHFDQLASHDEGLRLQFVAAETKHDIARRAVDIGIRNERPDQPWLAVRAIGEVAFAAYRRKGARTKGWLATTASTPSARWTRQHHGASIGIEVSAPRNLLDLMMQGAGVAVIPCLIGDPEPLLERASAPIRELTHKQWLVTHQDDRHDPQVRALLTRLFRLIRTRQPLFLGHTAQTKP